jgi:prepilin-type N-terminal cleavage/methylation domain-containing protein
MRRTTGRRLSGQRGFTLVELLITTAIVGVVMAGLYVTLSSGQESYLIGTNQAEAQQSLRLAVDRMVQELRNAGYCPTCSNSCTQPGNVGPYASLTAVSATGFTIQYDWNADYNCVTGTGINTTSAVNYLGTGTNRGENVVYALGAGNLTRQEIGLDGVPVVMASGIVIASSSFTYLDVTGAVCACTATPGNIRYVVISITAQPQNQPAATQQGRTQVTVQDTVRLRNRLL